MSITEKLKQKKLEVRYQNIDNCIWHIKQKAKTINDKMAVNGIVEYVNRTRKNIVVKNPLFAKMVVYVYGNVLKAHNVTPFDWMADNAVDRILSRDFDIAVANFRDELNFDELARRFEPITPQSMNEKTHPAFFNDDDYRQLLENYDSLPHDEKVNFWKKHYDIESVIDIINGVIANIVEKYND